MCVHASCLHEGPVLQAFEEQLPILAKAATLFTCNDSGTNFALPAQLQGLAALMAKRGREYLNLLQGLAANGDGSNGGGSNGDASSGGGSGSTLPTRWHKGDR